MIDNYEFINECIICLKNNVNVTLMFINNV